VLPSVSRFSPDEPACDFPSLLFSGQGYLDNPWPYVDDFTSSVKGKTTIRPLKKKKFTFCFCRNMKSSGDSGLTRLLPVISKTSPLKKMLDFKQK
jgi:hypothetical protein